MFDILTPSIHLENDKRDHFVNDSQAPHLTPFELAK